MGMAGGLTVNAEPREGVTLFVEQPLFAGRLGNLSQQYISLTDLHKQLLVLAASRQSAPSINVTRACTP